MKEEKIKLTLFKPKKRWVPTKSPHLPAKKLPYFKDNPPRYEAAHNPEPHEVNPTNIQPTDIRPTEVKPTPSTGFGALFGLGIFIAVIIIIVVSMSDDNGGGGSSPSNCPTYCAGGGVITVAKGCNCPSDSSYYNTITNGPCIGCKQCICN